MNNKEGNQIVCIIYSNTGMKIAIPIYKQKELLRKIKTLINFQ